MTQKQTRKILRIGIIQNGKIIEERLLRKREPVTVGESHKNTFVIPATGLPSRFPLFELKNNKYYLTVADWMDGRLSLGSGVSDLNGLKKEGKAQKVGQVDYDPPGQDQGAKKKVLVYQIILSEKSRGKLTFGDITLLFQFVTPPPLPVKPQLPAIIQGGWVKSIDWVYSTILLASFAAHLMLIAWILQLGPMPEVTMDQLPERFAKYIVPVVRPKPVVKPKDTGKKDNGKKKKKGGKKKKKKKVGKKKKAAPAKKKKTKSAAQVARERAQRRKKIAEKMARSGLLALLGSKNAKGGGALKDVMAGGGIYEKDLDRALKNVKGVAVAGAGSSMGRASRRGSGATGTLKTNAGSLSAGPKGGGTGGAGKSKRRGVRVKSKVAFDAMETEGTLNQSKLRRLIARKRRSVQYCYEKELKRNRSLSGKISIRITIATTGRVSRVEVEDNGLNAAVGRCIKRRIKRWRFPKPSDGAATVVLPFVFSSSG